MQKGKARNSHDTIMYAINGWAAWGFYKGFFAIPEPDDVYIKSKLRLYNSIANLFSGRIKKIGLPALILELQDTLIEHTALFPPSEATFALHEIIHVASQIPKVGPPRVNCLFMFERVNLYLKRMIKNKNSPMGSIMKAYAKEEFVTQKIGFDLTALKSLIQTIHCMPTNYNIVQRILTSFRNLHIDEENVMYSLPNCRVHELRGNEYIFSLDIQLSNSLMCALASLSRTDSVLDNIYCRYLGYMTSKSSKLRLFNDYA